MAEWPKAHAWRACVIARSPWVRIPSPPQMPKLNDNQLKQLADFMSNLGLVFFAISITPLFSGVDTLNIFSVLLGLVASIISLIVSLSLLKKG